MIALFIKRQFTLPNGWGLVKGNRLKQFFVLRLEASMKQES